MQSLPSLKKGTRYSYETLLQMRRPCIYAWVRSGTVLYVGTSGVGIGRFLGQHHVIGSPRRPLHKGDEIVVWQVPEMGRLETEVELIDKWRPRYNQHTNAPVYTKYRRRHEQRRCRWPSCNAPFRPLRSDQKYHLASCRNAHWREAHSRKVVRVRP